MIFRETKAIFHSCMESQGKLLAWSCKVDLEMPSQDLILCETIEYFMV